MNDRNFNGNEFLDRFSLSNRVAVVTAAGSGMGRSSALAFAAAGAHVYALDINPETLTALADETVNFPGSVEPIVLDATDDKEVQKFIDRVDDEHQRIDILHNHAGRPGATGVEVSSTDWNNVSDLNLRVPILMTSMALPLIRRSSAASLIYTASIGGLRASKDSPLYAAVKHGVVGYMRSVAALLGKEGIRANAICPGIIETPMMVDFFRGSASDPASATRQDVDEAVTSYSQRVPLGKLGHPDDIGSTALFLASDASRYITGVALPVDGGITAT